MDVGKLGRVYTAGSSDDFRSVIDDLTIENRKLKERLRKYEKLHSAHLQREKLFEVRVHGLPPKKKRELEETLRKFASSLDSSADDGLQLPINSRQLALPRKMHSGQAPSSSTSYSRPYDSAYASMSTSGPTSA